MTDKQQPEALRLANVCSNLTRYSMDAHLIAAELRRQHAELETLRAGYDAARLEIESLRAAQPAGAQHGVGNSGFDYSTAADFLNGKNVSDEAVRKFVSASRWAHDERSSLYAQLLSMRGELASREAEIALLKKALMDAEQAPAQPAPSYKDSTPELNVGDSAFESWYSSYSPAHNGDKQRARDAYAAGMGDSLVMAAPAAVAGPSDVVSIQRQAFIRGWDKRGMAHQLKGTVETDERMRALMDIYFPRTAAPTAQPAPQQEAQEPMAWRELCRRLYVELFYCNQQMTSGKRPKWQQGKTLRDVLADAKAALDAAPQPTPTPQADSVLEDAFKLLDEVAQCFTTDDGLPDNLLPRIDAAIAARAAQEGK